MSASVLEITGLCRNFGAIQVTRDVNLTLPVGARHALIGPNGAGKTTLVNQISGVLQPNAGRIALSGRDITRASPEQRVQLGIVRTFQINSLFPSLTVAENVALAVCAEAGLDTRPWGRPERSPLVGERVGELLARLGIEGLALARVADLAYGQRRLVEIALALALKPKVLLLDEPAAGLSSRDGALLLDILRQLPEEVAVLVIEHDMSLVFQFARTLTVLVDGAVLTEGDVEAVRSDPRVRDVYLGHRHND